MHRAGSESLIDGLERALNAVEGVAWAEVNPFLARVVVEFDEPSLGLDDIIDVIDAFEEANEISAGDGLDADWDHPGDATPLQWAALELGADGAGILLGVVARAARLPRLPIEIAASLPAIDNVPPIRRVLARHRPLEAGLISIGAVFQGLAQGPLGLMVDGALRVQLLREAAARRDLWERLEPRLASQSGSRAAPFDRDPRPRPLPDGPLETYARRVSLASLPVGVLAAFVRGDPAGLADVVLGAIPRAARLGREGFATELVCGLATNDILVFAPASLRRLDRIDTVLVDGTLLAPASNAPAVLVAAIHDAAQDFAVCRDASDGADSYAPDIVSHDDLRTTVLRMQEEGRVVAVVCGRPDAALAAADLGVGVITAGGVPPWGADVLCPNLYTAARIIEATAHARTASGRARMIAAAGSGVATAIAFGRGPLAGRRTALVNSGTSLVAFGVGIWTASFGRRPLPLDDAPAVAWHALDVDEVAASLRTQLEGLSRSAVEERQAPDEQPGPPGLATLFVQELANPLTLVLGAGAALSTVVGSLVDGVLVTGVIGANALVGAAQRVRTEHSIAQLAASAGGGTVRVRRDGAYVDVASSDLVDGDIIVLNAGDAVDADARVASASHLEADESALTGESLPVVKADGAVGAETPVAERASMVYAGTSVAAGQGEAIVVATGARTEARRGLRHGEQAPASGVEARLEDLTRRSVPLVLAAGAVLTASGLLRGVPAREAVATGTSLAAAAVPEGLPFLATVAQSSAARRLSKHGVLVRNPRVLEALGRVDVLCFDKTGTLTEGRLELRSVSDGEVVETMPAIDDRHRLVLAAALRATPERHGRELPHPTDQAVAEGAAAAGVQTQ